MKKFSFTIIIFLISAGSFCSCSKKGNSEPMEIPFTEYSLVGTLCQWTNFDYADKVIVINGNEDLGKYIDCTDGGYYPGIDFSRHTLLLACGGTTNGVREINTDFSKNALNKYILSIMVHLNISMVAQGWHISILVPKISDEAIIILDVIQTHY